MNNLLAADHSELDALLGGVFAALDSGNAARVYQKPDFFRARPAMRIRADNLHLFPALLHAFKSSPTSEKNCLSLETIESRIGQSNSITIFLCAGCPPQSSKSVICRRQIKPKFCFFFQASAKDFRNLSAPRSPQRNGRIRSLSLG